MKCPNCGQELKNDITICFSCGNKIDIDDTEEIETIINEIIEQEDFDIEDEEAKDKSNTKSKKNDKKVTKSISVKPIKIFIASTIGIFLLTMLFNWFSIGGNGAYLGYVDNDVAINTDVIIDALVEEDESYNILFSPFDLITYVNNNIEQHNTINTLNGKEKTSILSVLNMVYIYGFILIVVMAIISILLLIIPKSLRGINIVRNLSIISLIIVVLNYCAMKITFFNIFSIKAKSVLIENGINNKINLTKNGVAAGNSFFPYYMKSKLAFFIALVMLIIWLVVSSFLIYFKDRKKQKTSVEES